MESPPLPAKLQIEPVGRCNLRCPMCTAPYRPNVGEPALVDPALFRHIVESLPTLAEVHLQGIGEPLLHPCFFDLVSYAAQRGATVTTNSNLTILTDKMARESVDSGLDTLHVSIDAADARVYGSIRVGARLERVLANVDRINAARKVEHSSRPRLKLVMVLMRRTLLQLPGVLRLAAEKGFESVFVQGLSHRFLEPDLPERYRPLRAFAAHEGLDDLDPKTLSESLERARALADELGLHLRLPQVQTDGSERTGRCDWPWTQAYVCYDGMVLPCCMVSTPDRACLGSVKTSSLPEIWRGPELVAFRDRLSSDDPPTICQSCALYWGLF